MNTNLAEDKKADAAVESAVILKFGLDVHLMRVAVCVQVDGATPQPAQMIMRERVVEWIGKLRQKYPGARCVSCYEAGPLGYGLHRALLAAEVSNYVVTPERMDVPHHANSGGFFRDKVGAGERSLSGKITVFQEDRV